MHCSAMPLPSGTRLSVALFRFSSPLHRRAENYSALAKPCIALPWPRFATLRLAFASIDLPFLISASPCLSSAVRFSPLRICAFAAPSLAVAVRTGAMPLLCFPVAGFAFAPRVCAVRFIASASHDQSLLCRCSAIICVAFAWRCRTELRVSPLCLRVALEHRALPLP